MWRRRKLDADIIALIVETQERAVQAALEAVSACVSKTVVAVLDATLGPGVTPDTEAEAANNHTISRLQQMGKGMPDIGERPPWGEAPLDLDDDPDPTNLDKPFDSYEAWDVPPADDPLWQQSPSTQRAAFLRPGESPIPTEPSP